MAYENLMPGVYDAKLLGGTVQMIEALKQPALVLSFEFSDSSGVNTKMKFQSFLMTKDGALNKKTLNTLKTIGFSGEKIQDLNDSSRTLMDMTKSYQITVAKNDKGFWNIEWVNDLGGGVDKEKSAEGVAGFNFAKFNGGLAGVKRPAVKNYAPQKAADDDVIPF